MEIIAAILLLPFLPCVLALTVVAFTIVLVIVASLMLIPFAMIILPVVWLGQRLCDFLSESVRLSRNLTNTV